MEYRGSKCLNCGHPLDISDIYCPFCSQLNSEKQLSAKDFFAEFLSSILVYDSRLRSTFNDLLFRPGIITRNYVQGQRLKYANPFRFFLSVSIIFFLVNGMLQIMAPGSDANNSDFNPTPADQAVVDSVNSATDSLGTASTISGIDTNGVLDSIKTQAIQPPKEYLSDEELGNMNFFKSYQERFLLYHEFYEEYKIKDARAALDSLSHKSSALNRWIYSKNMNLEKIKENPSAFVSYLLSKIPFFLFFFTPFFALFFWLIYSRKKYTYVEHVIFIFHIFSFIFLTMLLFLIPDLILDTNFFMVCLFLFIGPIYFYKALRNFYLQSRLVTLTKYLFLNTVFVIGLSLTAAVFVAASAAVY